MFSLRIEDGSEARIEQWIVFEEANHLFDRVESGAATLEDPGSDGQCRLQRLTIGTLRFFRRISGKCARSTVDGDRPAISLIFGSVIRAKTSAKEQDYRACDGPRSTHR